MKNAFIILFSVYIYFILFCANQIVKPEGYADTAHVIQAKYCRNDKSSVSAC